MFVWINNPDMNINDIEKWIKTARDDNGGVISPEFAMEILGKTNHLGHIKKVLKNIKSKCATPEKMAPYKDFILSCVDRREMSGEAMDMLKEMADLCGCKDELEIINNKPKRYSRTDCEGVVVKLPENLDLSQCSKVHLNECDLSDIKKIKFDSSKQKKVFLKIADTFSGEM